MTADLHTVQTSMRPSVLVAQVGPVDMAEAPWE